MDERTHIFLSETGPVLCVDIGSHTQAALLTKPGIDPENWPTFTLPSPAQSIAQRIRELTILKKGIWLYGDEMGGGFTYALREHLSSELPTASTSGAALSIHDDIAYVQGMGIQICESCPQNSVPVYLSDFETDFWNNILKISGLPLPHLTLAAVQDHGNFVPGNRHGRIKNWQELLIANSDPSKWIYTQAPEGLTRLKTLQTKTGGPVADTAVCAILGAIADPHILDRSFREGITIIHAGNTHTLAALVYQGKVYGIYEHHTNKHELSFFREDLKQFRNRWLSGEVVHASGGNGLAFGKNVEEAGDFAPTFIFGPGRALFDGQGKFVAPHGDMHHAGCYGLLYGWANGHYMS